MEWAKRLGVVANAAMILTHGAAAAGAPYPTQAVRIVVPFGAGGVVDTIARQFANHLASSLGQPFVVERTGLAQEERLRRTMSAEPPRTVTRCS